MKNFLLLFLFAINFNWQAASQTAVENDKKISNKATGTWENSNNMIKNNAQKNSSEPTGAAEKFKNIIKNGIKEISSEGSCDRINAENQIRSITQTPESFIEVINFFTKTLNAEKMKTYIEEAFHTKTSGASYPQLYEYCKNALKFFNEKSRSKDKIIEDFSAIIPDQLEHLISSKKISLKRKIRRYLRKVTNLNLNKKLNKFPSFAEFTNQITLTLSIKERILTYELVMNDKVDLSVKQVYTYNACIVKAISKLYKLLSNLN